MNSSQTAPNSGDAGPSLPTLEPLQPSQSQTSPPEYAQPEPPWADTLRAENWAEGFRVLAQEASKPESPPELRLAAAMCARNTGDYAASHALLDGLDAKLPEISARIRAHRDEAAYWAADRQSALSSCEGRVDPESRLKAAHLYRDLGYRNKALTQVDNLLRGSFKRSELCTIEAPAHALRAELLPPTDLAGRAKELSWLALKATLCPAAEQAASQLQALPESYRLTKQQQLERAQAFANAGRVALAEDALASAALARGTILEPGVVEYVKGYARYQARSDLALGAELLNRAAALNANHRPEWLFYSARALERAQDTVRARALYARVQKFPNSSFADHAEYRTAQILYSESQFAAAAQAYDRYLANRGRRARFEKDARDERAIAWLASGKPGLAAREFREFSRTAREARERARYTELEGLALSRMGAAEAAKQRWLDVVHSYPLSFAAATAAARLASQGAAVAPPEAPSSTGSEAATPRLPVEVALLHRIGLDREAEQALALLEPGLRRNFAARSDEALCALYGRLAPAARRFRIGQGAAQTDELNRLPSNDRRWLWECVYPRPYGSLIQQVADEHSLEPDLLYAIMRQESSFRPDVTSPAQAVGLLQLMPATAARLAQELGIPQADLDLKQPYLNVRLGARYVRKLLDAMSGNIPLAVAAYNAGPAAVARWLDGAGDLGLDVFVARIPYEETRTYVERVVSNLSRYRYLAGLSPRADADLLSLPKLSPEARALY
ncbi:MAG TPA: lytic transglycosylase domain-containing protein [Polyangiaceae bacterium]|nr:lytic transglycosylase domain-containing protein [Polyangiaceae bacterium]